MLIYAKLGIDIIIIVLIILAVAITAIVLGKIVTDAFSLELPGIEEISLVMTDPDIENQSREGTSPRPSLPDSGTEESPYLADVERFEESRAGEDEQLIDVVYGSSPVILPVTWGAVIGAVIWRGRVRSKWSKQGYDYETFRLVAKMRGSPMRKRLLDSLKGGQKNKLQLAKELGVDWKTIDNHIVMLLEARLVEERNVVGTTRYYSLTESGERVLSLLAASEDQGNNISDDGK